MKWIGWGLVGLVLLSGLLIWSFQRQPAVIPQVPQAAELPAVSPSPTQVPVNQPVIAISEPSPPAEAAKPEAAPPSKPLGLRWITKQSQPAVDEMSPAGCELPVSEMPDGVRVLEFPHGVTGAAYDEESGHLALMSEQDGVRVYSIPEQLPDRVPAFARLLHGAPMNSLCRVSIGSKSAFAMACRGARVIRFVEARSLQSLSQVDVPDQGIAGRLTTDGRNALYYQRFTTRQEPPYTATLARAIGRVALDTMTIEDREFPEPRAADSLIQAHSNGEIYVMNGNHVSRMKWDDPDWKPRGWNLPNFGSFAFCPTGQRFFSGRMVWPLPMDRFWEILGRQTNRNVGLLLKSHPVGLSLRHDAIDWISGNDFRELQSIPLPKSWYRDTEPVNYLNGPFPPNPLFGEHIDPQYLAMFDDTPRKRAIVVLHRRVLVLPWPQALFPDEPWPTIPAAPIDVATIGEPVTLKVPPTPGIQWQFADSGPITGPDPTKRTWTPQPMNGQRILVPLVGQSKAGQWTQQWDIPVQWPGVDIPFQIKAARLSSSGRWAVVIGSRKMNEVPPEEIRQIALIDVTARKLVAQCEMPRPVLAAVVEEHGVYALISEDGYRVARLSLDDLSPQAASPTLPSLGDHGFLRPDTVDSIGGKYLVLPTQTVLRIPSLETDSSWEIRGSQFRNYGRVGDHWLMGGIVWDASVDTPQLIWSGNLEDPGIRRIVHPKASGVAASVVGLGNIDVHGADSLDVVGSFEVRDGMAILRSPPGQESLRTGNPNIQFDVIASVSLMDVNYRWASVAPGMVAFVNDSRLLLIPHRHWEVKSPAPVFVPKQSTFLLNLNRPNEVRYQLPGGRRYELEIRCTWRAEPDIKLENTKGEFSVDLSQISLQQLIQLNPLAQPGTVNWDLPTLQKKLKETVEARTPAFRKATGKAPKGMPFLISATVIGENEQGQKAGLAHQYYIDIPLDEYRKAYLPLKKP